MVSVAAFLMRKTNYNGIFSIRKCFIMFMQFLYILALYCPFSDIYKLTRNFT